MFMTVINGRVAIEATPDTPGAFKHAGTWYIYERDSRTPTKGE